MIWMRKIMTPFNNIFLTKNLFVWFICSKIYVNNRTNIKMFKNELILEKGGKFITRFGSTMNIERPNVVYLRTKSKITPLTEKKEYDKEVNTIKNKFASFVKETIEKSKSVNNDYLFNIDISSKSVKYGKVSFLRYDVYLKPTKLRTIKENRFRFQQLSTKFDKKLEKLNVDDKITNRINQHLKNSKTIELKDNTLEVKVSNEEVNAIIVKEDGIYVNDNTEQVQSNTNAIKSLKNSDKYLTGTTGSSPYTVGGIKEGTTAESLNGKTISDILDLMLFPAYVRNLISPTLVYSALPSLVEVGSSLLHPELIFTQNDAGSQTSTVETISFNDSHYDNSSYIGIGVYKYEATVNYEAGEYLVNNKGEITDSRIEAGNISTSVSTIATYPWYAGTNTQVFKQRLIAFNTNSGIQEISLSGRAVIKLPGANSQLLSFKVNGGLGFLNVDLNGWTQTTEQINGITYKVWSKNDEYSSVLPHQLQFKLMQ